MTSPIFLGNRKDAALAPSSILNEGRGGERGGEGRKEMNRQHFLETELETFPGNEPDEIWFKATGISIESFQGKILFQIQFNFVVFHRLFSH